MLKNIKKDTNPTKTLVKPELNELNSFIAQFYVFHGEKYLGWDCFDKSRVSIGKSIEADIVLPDANISDIQARFTITGNSIKVSDEGTKGALIVNDQIISSCTIGPFDFVKIGNYTIKIKLKKINDQINSFQDNVSDKVSNDKEKVTPIFQETITAPVQKDKEQIIDSHILSNTIKLNTKPEIKEKTEQEAKQKTESETKQKIEQDAKQKTESEIKQKTEQEVKQKTGSETKQKTEQKIEKTIELKPRPKPPVKEEKQNTDHLKRPELKNPELKSKTQSENNSFPPSFFTSVFDKEDEEDYDDVPANFSLKDKLTGSERNAGRTITANKLFEIIKLRGDNVVSITHLQTNECHCLINRKKSFCTVAKKEDETACLFFTEPLLGMININKDQKLETNKTRSFKSFIQRQNTYQAYLPVKGETKISDNYYDYILRPTFIKERAKDRTENYNDLPLKKRIVQSTAFKNFSKAIIAHLVVLIVLSFSISIPDIEEFKNPETHFVVVDTTNIHKPVKPLPKPKPKRIIRKKTKKTADKKTSGRKVASLRKKRAKKSGKPKAGGGHKGNFINRNVNDVGLLGALGFKTGISVKSNETLAAVTNIDAISSSHSKEARIKIGGIVGSLGDRNIAIPTGGVFNTKGSTDVLRSAGIGGDGSIAALEAGNTGQRSVEGIVSAPLTRKVRFKGGGISRDAVAKVINEHLDEISYCYEASLIGDPSLMGKVVFEWKILVSGKVGEVKIKSSTLRSDEIHSCIKSAIRTWRFPKPKGGAAIISYPFVFDVSGF